MKIVKKLLERKNSRIFINNFMQFKFVPKRRLGDTLFNGRKIQEK